MTEPLGAWAAQGILGLVIATLLPVIFYLYRRIEKLQEELVRVTAELHEKRLAEGREVLKVVHDATDAMNKSAAAENGLGDLIRAMTQKGGGRGSN